MATKILNTFSKVCADVTKIQIATKPRLRGYLFSMFGTLLLCSNMAWSYGETGSCNIKTVNITRETLDRLKDLIPNNCDKGLCNISWHLPYIADKDLNTADLADPKKQFSTNIKNFEGLRWTDNRGGGASIWPQGSYKTWVPNFNRAAAIQSDRIEKFTIHFSRLEQKETGDRTYLEMMNKSGADTDFQEEKENWMLVLCKNRDCRYTLIKCKVRAPDLDQPSTTEEVSHTDE